MMMMICCDNLITCYLFLFINYCCFVYYLAVKYCGSVVGTTVCFLCLSYYYNIQLTKEAKEHQKSSGVVSNTTTTSHINNSVLLNIGGKLESIDLTQVKSKQNPKLY